jgi:hypothetical protein
VDATCLPENALASGRLIGIIKQRNHRRNPNSYNIEFQVKAYKNIMFPADEVHPYLVDVLPTGPPNECVESR